MSQSQRRSKPSPGFLVTVAILLSFVAVAKPLSRWAKDRYDAYKASTTVLTATSAEYDRLLRIIKSQQPRGVLRAPAANASASSEQIFQAAISPTLLGRSSRYEPNTSSGSLACAWMVNMAVKQALNYRIGENPLYVPSMVHDLDQGSGRRVDQAHTRRGDLAIANGTNYERGLWHIGICMNDGCGLVLSNSPTASRFDWLSDANFDGVFAHNPGQTTFYHILKLSRSASPSASR